MKGPQRAHRHCQNPSATGELKQLNVKNLSKYKPGNGGLYALQKHSQSGIQRISNTVEDQECGIMPQLRQIETPREGNVQAGVQSQANLQEEFRTSPRVDPEVDVQNEQHEVEKERNKRNQSNFSVQRGIERYMNHTFIFIKLYSVFYILIIVIRKSPF